MPHIGMFMSFLPLHSTFVLLFCFELYDDVIVLDVYDFMCGPATPTRKWWRFSQRLSPCPALVWLCTSYHSSGLSSCHPAGGKHPRSLSLSPCILIDFEVRGEGGRDASPHPPTRVCGDPRESTGGPIIGVKNKTGKFESKKKKVGLWLITKESSGSPLPDSPPDLWTFGRIEGSLLPLPPPTSVPYCAVRWGSRPRGGGGDTRVGRSREGLGTLSPPLPSLP